MCQHLPVKSMKNFGYVIRKNMIVKVLFTYIAVKIHAAKISAYVVLDI